MYFKWKIHTIYYRKHCEKRRNCLLHVHVVSPFSHNVFYSYISLVCQHAVLWGNGLKQVPWCGDHHAYDRLLLWWRHLFAISQQFLAFFFFNFRVYWDCRLVEWGCVILGLAWSLITMLTLSIEITDICWLFNLIVDYFFNSLPHNPNF